MYRGLYFSARSHSAYAYKNKYISLYVQNRLRAAPRINTRHDCRLIVGLLVCTVTVINFPVAYAERKGRIYPSSHRASRQKRLRPKQLAMGIWHGGVG